MAARMIVVGSVMMDLILQTDRMPQAGESVLGQTYSNAGGGKGANAAVAAARLGGKVALYATVGRDSHGEALRERLGREGLDTTFLATTGEANTGLAVVMLEQGGTNRLIIFPGANHETGSGGLERAFAQGHEAVLLQLEIPFETNRDACRLAQARGMVTCLDAGPAQDFPLEQLPALTILSPNETETLALTGILPADEPRCLAACRVLQQRNGCRFVVLKLGERGAYVYGDSLAEWVPGHRVTCVDPTAAGDCFTGALVLKYVETRDILASVRYANAAAAVSVQSLGAQPSLPSAAQVAEFLAERSR